MLCGVSVWEWTDKHVKAFVDLKNNFLNCVTLSYYDPNRTFKLQTDASDIGISGILYQQDENGDPYIIALVSRVLTKYERNYTVTEKELLAIIYSVLKFRYYLIGTTFDIITDHKSLTFLLTSPFNSARLMRWILCLQEYSFRIMHCKGSENIVADFFSRNFQNEAVERDCNYVLWRCVKQLPDMSEQSPDKFVNMIMIAELKMKPELIKDLKSLEQHQNGDSVLNTFKLKPPNNFELLIENNLTYTRTKGDNAWKLWLPSTLVSSTLRSTHEQLGHAGSYKLQSYATKSYKLQSYLARFFYWCGMRRDIKIFTKSCDSCQRVKYLNVKMEGGINFYRRQNQMN